jgi:hypothetical protein
LVPRTVSQIKSQLAELKFPMVFMTEVLHAVAFPAEVVWPVVWRSKKFAELLAEL